MEVGKELRRLRGHRQMTLERKRTPETETLQLPARARYLPARGKYRLRFLLQAITCQCSEDRSVSVYRVRQSTAITAGQQLLLACKLKMMWGWGSYDGSGNEISGGRELNERRDHFAVVYVQFPWLHDQSAEPILSIALISHQEFRMA